MRRLAITMTSIPAAFGSAAPAQACRMHVDTELEDVRFADVVVVGRIANYRIIPDEEIRRQRREQLARPDLAPSLRAIFERQTSFLTDYARFDILVDDVLVGQAGRKLTVTWDNSTFGEPASMPSGPYLIALRRPSSNTPPLRGPSATIMPNREPGSLTVLQAPCASAFIFERGSDSASAIRRLLSKG